MKKEKPAKGFIFNRASSKPASIPSLSHSRQPSGNSSNLPDIAQLSLNNSLDSNKSSTQVCVIDETTPRQCTYIGSFEVKCQTPKERGEYITEQLKIIADPNNQSEEQQIHEYPVVLMLSLSGIQVCDPTDIKKVLQNFALRRISFSTAEPELGVFAISAREPNSPPTSQYAHIFKSDSAQEINQIIGVAFKQAYTLDREKNVQTPAEEQPSSQSLEQKIMSEMMLKNKTPQPIQRNHSIATKRSSLPPGSSLKDCSSEFVLQRSNSKVHKRTNSAHFNSHSRSGSGNLVTYTYSTAGSSHGGNNAFKLGYETSGYDSPSLSSGGSLKSSSLEKNKSLDKFQSSINNPVPFHQWHQPDLHPDTARDLLVNLPLGSFYVVGSHSPLNLMIRGEKNIWQTGIVITNKGFHLLLTSKQRKNDQVPVFGTLPALIYHYINMDKEKTPLPQHLRKDYSRINNLTKAN